MMTAAELQKIADGPERAILAALAQRGSANT
jgi:hypothetical protein